MSTTEVARVAAAAARQEAARALRATGHPEAAARWDDLMAAKHAYAEACKAYGCNP